MRCGLIALVAVTAGTCAAQSLTGVIAGTVRDAQGLALPGAVVTLAGRTGAVPVAADSEGNYQFPAVEPGPCSVRAEAPGFRPQRREGIAIHTGARLIVDFLLAVGNVTDSVEVVAEPSLIDVRGSSFRISLTQDQLFNLPLIRDVQQLQDALPGINNTSAFGAHQNSNALYLDGVDTRDPQNGAAWLVMNYNLLEEVQLQGPGAPAEYGAFTGAVINSVTRSGGNAVAGLFEARYSGRGLASDNVDEALVAQNPALDDPSVTTRLVDLTAQLSGPVRKDSLFFLVNGQLTDQTLDPSGARTSQEDRGYRGNGRLTWNPSPRDHVAVGGAYDTRQVLRAGASGVTDQLTLNSDRPEASWTLQWRHLFGASSLLEARYLGWTTTAKQVPQQDVAAHLDVATSEKTGSAGFFSQTDQDRHQAHISVSRYAEAFGRHDLKFGVEIERIQVRNQFRLSGTGLYYFDLAGQPYLAASYSFDADGRAHRDSVYAQDGWRPTDRLTLNLGVRLDLFRGKDEDVVYEARGLAQRLGMALDVGREHRTVVRAAFGTYYDALPVWYFFPALNGIEDWVNYANTGSGLVEIGRSNPGLATVDADIRHPKIDEVALGLDRALGNHIRLSVTGILRRSGDFIDRIYPGARFQAVSTTNPLTGHPLTTYRLLDASVSGVAPFITNVDGLGYLDPDGALLGTAEAYRKYRGVMITASRRLDGRWQAQASYVLSKSEGTVDNGYYDAFGPFATRVQDYSSANSALVNAEGRLLNDYRQEIKLLGSYRIPRLEVGLNGYFRILSGTTYTPVAFLANEDGNIGDVRLEPRGSRRLPTVTLLDLRVEKAFRLRRGRLGFYADVTNVFNANAVAAAQDRVPGVTIAGHELPFGAPLAILPARQTTLGVRWFF